MFIFECIKLLCENKELKLEQCYDIIGSSRGKKPGTIKGDIQGAVNKMWRYCDRNKVRSFFRLGTCDKLTPVCVVHRIKYYIENK